MSLTDEESNFLRFYYINLKVASKAVRVYFDTIYPPVGLAKELINNEAHLKSLRFITNPQINILYPNSGNIVKSEQFDTTLLICLLRNMQPYKVAHHKDQGWDKIPKATETSFCADLCRAKRYRNFVSHHEKGELTVKVFNQHCGDLEQAIARLGGPSMLKQAQSAQHIVLDTYLKEMLNRSRKQEKDIQHLYASQEKCTSIIKDALTEIKKQRTIIEQLKNRIQKQESASSKHSTEIAENKETIDKCIETIETLKKEIEENEEINKGIQVDVVKIHQQFVDLTHHLLRLEIKCDKKFKEIDDHFVEHDDQIATCVTKINNMEKTHFHTGGSKQKRLEEDTRALIKEDEKEGTFVITKAVTDGLLLLKQNGVLLITGYAGTGKSRIGRHILDMYCTDNISYKCIKLNTLGEWEDMVKREHNVVVLLDDIFGETNCIYNREKDTPILEKVYAYVCEGNIKVIITIRDTVKRQCQEVFDSHRLFQSDFIDLSSQKYLLSQEEKCTVLTKYMRTVRQSDFIESKGYVDCNDDIILKNDEVLNITLENPIKGFPLVVYQFVHNDKYFKLGSKFFDRPTEAMLEEMNAIRRKGENRSNFMIQYAVMVYTAVNENCINPDNNTTITEIPKIIDAIYEKPVKLKKCHISDAVNELGGSHLINIPNQRSYRFHHPTLQESVILSFAQIDEANINKIIPLISWSFFLKMVKPVLYVEKEGEVVLRVPSNSFKLLADRLKDLFKEEIWIYQYELRSFIQNLCNTEIFQHEYNILLPYLLEAFEREDEKDNHTENMIKSFEMNSIESIIFQTKNKDTFLVFLLNTLAELESQLDIYNFVLKTFNTILKTSSNQLTIGFMKSALISSLYKISSTKDVRYVKATLDIIEENNIPVLLDQGIIPTNFRDIYDISDFVEDVDNETCVFLTLCIWEAYAVLNISVLEFLLKKYSQTPFDINLFFKIIYKERWIENMSLSHRKTMFEPLKYRKTTFEPLKWMIETFQDQKLDDPNFILRFACKFQMFDTVEYVASVCKTYDEISCLEAFVDECLLEKVPFNKKLFDFLIKRIDITSKDLIPVVKSVIKKRNVPDYIFDGFLRVCINNAHLLTLACENLQFYLVNLIIESSHFEHSDIQSALMAACKASRWNNEGEKLKMVKYIVDTFGFDQFDYKVVCQQACSSKEFQIIEWLVQNIDTTRLDVYTIINSALVANRSDMLERVMKKIEIESLDKRVLLKSVTEHYTTECSTTVLKIVRTVWDSIEGKEVLHMEEVLHTAYTRKSFALLKWIHENCHPHISIDSKKVLMLACEDDRIDVAKWVVQTFEQTSLDIDGGTLFIKACNTYLKYYIQGYGGKEMIETLNWILATFQIQRLDIVSGVLKLINVHDDIRNELYDLVVSLLDTYSSCIKPEDMKEIINTCFERRYYRLVNWCLENRSSCSFDKQMILNNACRYTKIETLKMLCPHLYALDMNQAMINACISSAVKFDLKEFNFLLRDFNEDQSVACLNLLWNEIDHDSIDMKTIVSTTCQDEISNNVMTWILRKLPLDQIPINEVLIFCCQQQKIHHVKYIVHEVDNEKLDIKEAFVQSCLLTTDNGDLFIVDYLFQMQNDKDSFLSLVVNELFEKKNFKLILYFLQAGYCRNTNMKTLLKEACRYGQVKLVQWIVANVEHKELDIKSAFHKACDSTNHIYEENYVVCLALLWHYIHDINMFEIDTVLKTIQEPKSHTSISIDELKTWLLYIKRINQRIYQSDNALLNSEENINLQSK